MTLQRRIGIIFFTLSAITAVANLIFIDRTGAIFNIITCAFYLVVFSITIAWESKVSQILQIVCFIIAAFFSLYIDSNKMFGTSILVIEILVLYSYGFFKRDLILKILITVLVIFAILFITIHQKNEAVMILLFISFITGSMFMILYDELKKVYSKLDESMTFAEHAMEIIRRIAGNASKQ